METKHLVYAAVAVAVFALFLGGAAVYMLFLRAPVLGGDCGTVSPGFRDECCANRNAGNPQILCVGRWVYDSGAGCSYRCDGTEPPLACTMEAKLCPDGTAVGRNSANNCEFDPCPGGGLIGGDVDSYGCLVAAGYSWNESASVCMRQWSGEIQDVKGHVCTESEKENIVCTMDYTPVCGSDGVTYGNGCGACASKADSWTKGECPASACDTCPVYSPPAPGWCEGGSVEVGRVDGCGCRGPPRCVRQGGEGTLLGRVTVGPLCPVERDPPDPSCQPTEETYKSHKLIVYGLDEYGSEYVAGEFTGGADGSYSIRLPEGSYLVRTEKARGFGSFVAEVTVMAGETSELGVDIDTGIR